MAKKLRMIAAVLIFWGIFLLLLSGISEIFRAKAGKSMDLVHSFYSIEKNTLDVLGLGSSHLYYSLAPNLLWGEYGIAAYNLGSPQQSMAMSYFLLKEALHYQKPKVVLLESHHFWYETAYRNEARLRQGLDGMRMGRTKLEMIRELLPELSLKEKFSYYVPFMMYHSRWSELNENDIDPPLAFSLGARLTAHIEPSGEKSMEGVEMGTLPEISLQYFQRIIELCKENQIQLVVFASPIAMKKKQFAFHQGLNLAVENYLLENEKEIPFLFYQQTGELGIDYARDFADDEHLNMYGQRKLTLALGNYLVQNYGLIGHKTDPAYAKWDDDYARYIEYTTGLERGGAEGA